MDLETTLAALAPKLLRFCLGQGGDPYLAEEAAQDAMTALVRRWQRLGAPESPDAFAFAIARRRLRRSLWRKRWFEPLENLFDDSSPAPDPETRAVDKQSLDVTLDALQELPENLREALLLVTSGELDGNSAAQTLGISLSALKMRLHRARKQLRGRLQKLENLP